MLIFFNSFLLNCNKKCNNCNLQYKIIETDRRARGLEKNEANEAKNEEII